MTEPAQGDPRVMNAIIGAAPKIRGGLSVVGIVCGFAALITWRRIIPGEERGMAILVVAMGSFLVFGQLTRLVPLINEARRAGFVLAMFIVFSAVALSLAILFVVYLPSDRAPADVLDGVGPTETTREPEPAPDELGLVSVSLPEDGKQLQQYPRIEAKLSNTRKTIAFITRARVSIVQRWPLAAVNCFGGTDRVKRSADHPVYFADDAVRDDRWPAEQSLELRQEIRPNSVEYFSLTMSLPWNYAYEVRVVLVYDGSREVATGPLVLAATTSNTCFCIRDEETARDLAKQDANTVDKVTEALRINWIALDALSEVAGIKSAYFRRLEACTQRDHQLFPGTPRDELMELLEELVNLEEEQKYLAQMIGDGCVDQQDEVDGFLKAASRVLEVVGEVQALEDSHTLSAFYKSEPGTYRQLVRDMNRREEMLVLLSDPSECTRSAAEKLGREYAELHSRLGDIFNAYAQYLRSHSAGQVQ